jgi:DNA (cytosine-5)-methyltransferase 1
MKFIDLFAGTGGMRLGFEQAMQQFNIETQCVLSAEIDPKACQSYELNFGENPYRDITTINEIEPFDFMLAGFPCQSFSYAGKQKGFGDTRGTLFFEVERLLKLHQPIGFLLENVRGLTTHDNGRTFQTIINSLEKIGYKVDYFLLNSSNFGVPQNRVRIYIVGLRDRQPNLTLESDVGAADSHTFKYQANQLSLFAERKPQRILVKDILENDVDPKYFCSELFVKQLSKVVGNDFYQLDGVRLIDYRGGNSIHSWELGIKGDCTANEIEFMNLLISNRRKKIFGEHQDGKSLTKDQILTFYHRQDFEEVTQSLMQKGYLSLKNHRFNPVCGNMSFEVFKFLDPNSISITLTASDTNRLGIVQNNIPRKITPRECARLQGYPESYKLLNDDSAVYKQMGNGVSVPVIQAILTNLIEHNFSLFEASKKFKDMSLVATLH